jgi:hypothetical protein
MFNEEIDELIRIAVKDGVVTQTEWNILESRAEALGIDRDELIMVLDDKLDARREELQKEDEERWDRLFQLWGELQEERERNKDE